MTAPIILGLDPDLQVAALLIIVSIVGFVVWWVRAIRAAGRSVRRDRERWDGEIVPWDDGQPVDVPEWVAGAARMEAEAAERIDAYLDDLPYDQETDDD